MNYFIDGYNLIRSADWLAAGTLREQRDRLLRFVEEKRPQGAAARVTVVFDGRADVTSPRHGGPTRVVFSTDRDADWEIKRLVDELARPREAVVVTDDRAIQKWVRGSGARVLSCAEFLKAAAAPRPPRAAPGLDPETAREITEDLSDLWKTE